MGQHKVRYTDIYRQDQAHQDGKDQTPAKSEERRSGLLFGGIFHQAALLMLSQAIRDSSSAISAGKLREASSYTAS